MDSELVCSTVSKSEGIDHLPKTLQEINGLREELSELRKFVYGELDHIKRNTQASKVNEVQNEVQNDTEELNNNSVCSTENVDQQDHTTEEGNIGQREPTGSRSNGESNAGTNTIQNIQKPEPLMARPIPKPSINKQTSNKKNTNQGKTNLVPGPRLYKNAHIHETIILSDSTVGRLTSRELLSIRR